MGKKKLRPKYFSKGTGDGQSWDLTKQCRREKPIVDKLLHKFDAWEKGKNPWMVIANPAAAAHSNKPFIRIKANDYLGSPKDCWSMQMLTKKKEAKKPDAQAAPIS